MKNNGDLLWRGGAIPVAEDRRLIELDLNPYLPLVVLHHSTRSTKGKYYLKIYPGDTNNVVAQTAKKMCECLLRLGKQGCIDRKCMQLFCQAWAAVAQAEAVNVLLGVVRE